MKTVMPKDLRPGMRLAAYDDNGKPLPPVSIRSVTEGGSYVRTSGALMSVRANVAVEIAS